MISSTKVQEHIASIKPYTELNAVAEATVENNGKVTVVASVYLMGMSFSLEEVLRLMVELPKAAERAAALSARLTLDVMKPKSDEVQAVPRRPSYETKERDLKSVPYEAPVVTPVANLNDQLAEVCTPSEPVERILVVINGQEIDINVLPSDDLAHIRDLALAKTSNTGQRPENWEIRTDSGILLLNEMTFSELVMTMGTRRLFMNPRAGIGGSLLAQAPTNCSACAYSGIEPNDMDLSCGHPDAGTFGVSLRKEPAAHCPDRIKFEQHPGRNPDGSLKPTVIPGI